MTVGSGIYDDESSESQGAEAKKEQADVEKDKSTPDVEESAGEPTA